MAALKRRESFDKRIERLGAENERLRRKNERLREIMQLLPPESFLAEYYLLYEDAYLTLQPGPEVRAQSQKPGEEKGPIHNFRSHRMKVNVDKQLARLKYQIVQYLENDEPIPEPQVQKRGQISTRNELG